ncbi:MAG: hypothetical protein ABR985_14025 [Methanotrichaceae archaeon]|jgi:transposase
MLASSLKGLAYDLGKFGLESLPDSFNQLVDRVERVEGVRFRELFHRLAGPQIDGNPLLKEIVEMARSAKP